MKRNLTNVLISTMSLICTGANQMKTLFVVPAYGHRYKDKDDLLKGWYEGKDFRILGMGPYLSIRDDIPNTEIYAVCWDEKFRYGKVLLPPAEIEDDIEDEDEGYESDHDDYDGPGLDEIYSMDNPADDYIMSNYEEYVNRHF